MGMEPATYEPGTLLYDAVSGQVGAYQDRSGPYALLRPVGGGREWQAKPEALRPATDRERIGAQVKAANERTRSVLTVPLEDLSRPPQPVRGCLQCVELDTLREAAYAVSDRSAETDANVLMRKHQRQEHHA